jgi:S-adenosylmethionine hydrolase
MGIITLTTDFGLRDWFVGTMKGVILGIAPQAQIIDITHDIAPGDVRAGAFALAAAARFFPRGTVHVAVVDPGVGSDRSAIVVQTRDGLFVGPDNAVLSLAVAGATSVRVHRLEDKRWFLKSVSQTFHGRDVFAPVAAHLSNGVSVARIGPRTDEMQRLEFPEPSCVRNRWTGCVVYIDRFGNAITNLPADLPIFRTATWVHVRVRNSKSGIPVCSFYEAVRKGRPVAVVGSSGFLEIAVNGGNAATALRLAVGDPVVLAPRRRD